MKILSEYLINDYRTVKELNGISLSGYKKSDVNKEMVASIKKGLIENSCYWASELICSGYIKDILNNIVIYSCKEINIGNPNLPQHLWERYKYITNNCNLENVIDIRNNQIIRNSICELITILCLSKKNKSIEKMKIDNNDFDEHFVKTKLKADNFNLTNDILLKDDPSEVRMIINEFSFHLHYGNLNLVIYWLSWLTEWDKLNIKKNGKFLCASRSKYTKIYKYSTDYIWLIWEVLINETVKYKNIDQKKNIQGLVNIYMKY